MQDCPYCDKPLDKGHRMETNGLHQECHEAMNLEMLAAFPEEAPGPQEPGVFDESPVYALPLPAAEAMLVF